jgi:hypothetical protein
VLGVMVANHGPAVDARAKDGRIDVTGRIEVTASLAGARRLALLHNGRELSMVDGASGTLAAPAAAVGAGPIRLQVAATVREGTGAAAERVVTSAPLLLRVGP